MGFPRQEYWSGLPFLSLGDLPDLGIKPSFPALAHLKIEGNNDMGRPSVGEQCP